MPIEPPETYDLSSEKCDPNSYNCPTGVEHVMADDDSLLKTIDSIVPAPVAQFDAFPKLPSTYKSRSNERGFLTIFVAFIALLLVLNDIGEFIWGWQDFEFDIDHDHQSLMDVTVDMVVNMPCRYLSVDLKDNLGDRLFLTDAFRREGTHFDVSQATALKEHSEALSAPQAIRQSRQSLGFFGNLFASAPTAHRPLYKHTSDVTACRISGTMSVKKMTANLHVTVLGHGYRSAEHVEHSSFNLSHVISEFSFGPYFPEITQPLDYTYELTHENFMAYQYYLHVVPTTYIAPWSAPLKTNQYSVTQYARPIEHGRTAPGIFFKFDIDALQLTVMQRTTSLRQLVVRCVGVIGGIFVCVSYAVRITYRVANAVSDSSEGTIAASSGVRVGLREQWGDSSLRVRPNRAVRQDPGWSTNDYIGPLYDSHASAAPLPYAPAVSGNARNRGITPLPIQGLGSDLSPPTPLYSGNTILTAATVGSTAPSHTPAHERDMMVPMADSSSGSGLETSTPGV